MNKGFYLNIREEDLTNTNRVRIERILSFLEEDLFVHLVDFVDKNNEKHTIEYHLISCPNPEKLALLQMSFNVVFYKMTEVADANILTILI